MLQRPALVSQEQQVSFAQPQVALSATTAEVSQPLVVALYWGKEGERKWQERYELPQWSANDWAVSVYCLVEGNWRSKGVLPKENTSAQREHRFFLWPFAVALYDRLFGCFINNGTTASCNVQYLCNCLSARQRLLGDLGQFLKLCMPLHSDIPFFWWCILKRVEFISGDTACSSSSFLWFRYHNLTINSWKGSGCSVT